MGRVPNPPKQQRANAVRPSGAPAFLLIYLAVSEYTHTHALTHAPTYPHPRLTFGSGGLTSAACLCHDVSPSAKTSRHYGSAACTQRSDSAMVGVHVKRNKPKKGQGERRQSFMIHHPYPYIPTYPYPCIHDPYIL